MEIGDWRLEGRGCVGIGIEVVVRAGFKRIVQYDHGKEGRERDCEVARLWDCEIPR